VPDGEQHDNRMRPEAEISVPPVASGDGSCRAASSGDTDDLLLPLLFILTAVSGVFDAVSYLKLGHVFVANMTGNIMLMSFAVGGASSLSAVSSAVSLAAFTTGAVVGGQLARWFGARRARLLISAIATEAVLVAVALFVAAGSVSDVANTARYVLIVLLAFAMGLQNAVARHSGVAGVNTTALTLTISAIAADSPLVGGNSPHLGRRLGAVAAMLVGAAAGGLLVVHVAVKASLGLAVGLLLLADLGCLWFPASDAPRAHES
jgi:uncharacterized membrane protein YoaK (UPF0700 family)